MGGLINELRSLCLYLKIHSLLKPIGRMLNQDSVDLFPNVYFTVDFEIVQTLFIMELFHEANFVLHLMKHKQLCCETSMVCSLSTHKA